VKVVKKSILLITFRKSIAMQIALFLLACSIAEHWEKHVLWSQADNNLPQP
jgi:hypothetical protein